MEGRTIDDRADIVKPLTLILYVAKALQQGTGKGLFYFEVHFFVELGEFDLDWGLVGKEQSKVRIQPVFALEAEGEEIVVCEVKAKSGCLLLEKEEGKFLIR